MHAGVPIDMVGGTSIGSLVGALYCEEKDSARVEKRAREFAKKMARFGDKILDLTYPHSAMFSGQPSIKASPSREILSRYLDYVMLPNCCLHGV